MAIHNELGKEGEKIAENFLKQKGYHILEKNWKYGKLEIDLIAMTSTHLVIIEVKSRRDKRFNQPEKAVDRHKINRLIIATQAYIERNEIDLPVQFDIVTVVGLHKRHTIEHFENAFYSPIM